MNPITREEQYLNRLTGEEGIIPDKPVTREEQYFARLCGGDNVIPDKPVTRREQYLATLCGEDVITPTKPVTRIEQYMAFASGESESKPEKPITREEMYWDKYQGGDVPEEKTIAFTDIITVTDALARPAVDLQAEITATQNLNGYEYPWVGGAGKNKLNVADLSIAASSSATTPISDNITLAQGTYTFSWTLDKTITATRNRPCYISGSYVYAPSDYKTSGRGSWTFTLEEEKTLTLAWWTIDNSDAITISDFQLEIGSTATTYTPYENICPISGHDSVNVIRTGVNVWDEVWELGYINNQGQNSYYNNAIRSKNYIPVKPDTDYYITASDKIILRYYDAEKNFIGGNDKNNKGSIAADATDRVRTTQSNCAYIRFYADEVNTYNNDIAVNYPSTATAYEPYEGDTFNTELGRTVYGGTLDLTTGELTLTHAYEDLYSRDWLYSPSHNYFRRDLASKKNGATNFITTNYRTVDKDDVDELLNGEITGAMSNNYIILKDERATSAAELLPFLTGAKICYELKTPQTISLTPTEVMMLENNNTIWADSGRVQLTYLSKAAERVQTMNASLQANALKLSGIKITKRTPTM